MLDPKVIEQMIQDQVTTMVTDQVMQVFASDSWLEPLETKIIRYTQDHLLRKFSNASAMPEIIEAVKQGVTDLFVNGQIPKLDEFINPATITVAINKAIEDSVQSSIELLYKDTQWLFKVEQMIKQAVVQETIARIGSMDINTTIKERVDENMEKFHETLKQDFSSIGISDQATQNQMTIMDDHTVFENILTAKNLQIADSAQVQNLVVLGSVNTDNPSWQGLTADIGEKVLKQINNEWRNDLVEQVSDTITSNGIDFNRVTIDGELLVDGNQLNSQITQSNIQRVGTLGSLQVSGETHMTETMHVIRKRVGINTEEPEQALSVWDEEVSINLGKYKLNTAYIGTGRAQALSIGTNRTSHIEINADGMTQIKKLRVGVHQISHDTQVPGWSGTKGDIVFNSNFGSDRVFAWICLGQYKWQPLKTAE